MLPLFVEAEVPILTSAPAGYAGRYSFAAPSAMKPGDELVAIFACDGEPGRANLGKLAIISRDKYGTSGNGITVQLVSAVSESLATDTPTLVVVNFQAGVSTWNSVATLFDGSTYVKTRQNTGGATTLIVGDAGTAVTANPGINLPLTFAPSVEWSATNLTATGGIAGLKVFRRTVTDDEPISYAFDQVESFFAMGAILCYRNLVAGAPIGLAGAEFFNNARPATPAIAMTRPSDLYLGVAWLMKDAGCTTAAPPSLGIERADVSIEIFATPVRRLEIFEYFPRIVGPASRWLDLGAANDGAAMAVALPGKPTLGAELAFDPIVPGAIGLPTEGI